jgi:stage II sporulation protein D
VAAGVLRVAGKRIGRLRDIRIASRSGKARVTKIEVVGSEGIVPIEGDRLRLALGEGGGLPSTLFGIEKREGEGGRIEVFEVFGGGFGHGVGMCQFGAIAMARNGADRDTILRHYYPGCRLSRPGGAL